MRQRTHGVANVPMSEKHPRALRAGALLWAGLLLASVVYTGLALRRGLPLETDLLKLLPQGARPAAVEQATAAFLKEISQRVVILVRGSTFEISGSIADRYSAGLHTSGLFTRVDSRRRRDALEDLETLYFAARSGLYSDELEKVLTASEPVDAVTRRVFSLLSGPMSGGIGRFFERDPLLLFPDFLNQLRNAAPAADLRDGHLVASVNGEQYIVLQATLARSVFDRQFQREVSILLDRLDLEIREHFPDAAVKHFGALSFAAVMANQAEHDVALIGAGSFIGTALLIILVFRSGVPLLATLITVTVSITTALAATLLAFGSIHALTLSFGASLIGVCADYSLHFFSHGLKSTGNSSWTVVRRIAPGIVLGAVTTALGYIALFLVPFPGLREIAFFSIAGLASTILTIVLLFPFLPGRLTRSPGVSSALLAAQRGGELLGRWFAARRAAPAALFFALALLPGFSRLETDDDVRHLQRAPENLVEAERLLATAVVDLDRSRFVLACGSSESDLLERLDGVSAHLDAAVATGTFQRYYGLSRFVPPLSEQARKHGVLQTFIGTHKETLAARFAEFGADENTVRRRLDELAAGSPVPVTLDRWIRSTFAEPINFLLLPPSDTDRCSIVLLEGVRNPAALEALFSQRPDVTYVDLLRDSTQVLRTYRIYATWAIGLCYLLVAAILVQRFGIRTGLLCVFTPLGALLVTLALQGYLGIPLTLFSVLANALVLGLAVDYPIFLLESEETRGPAFLVIALSSATTILSFGLLALSDAAVLHGFGITVFLGVLSAFVLCPVVLRSNQR